MSDSTLLCGVFVVLFFLSWFIVRVRAASNLRYVIIVIRSSCVCIVVLLLCHKVVVRTTCIVYKSISF
jgi:hypothetical protein